jgi:hypothetical protein
MKTVTVLVVLSGFLAAQFARVEEPDGARLRWVIVATIVDRTTGQPLQQVVLGGPELEFEDAPHCTSILDRIHPVLPEGLSIILICRKLPVQAEEII